LILVGTPKPVKQWFYEIHSFWFLRQMGRNIKKTKELYR